MKSKKLKNKSPSLKFPAKVLLPVSQFLRARLDSLKRSKKEASREDPFSDPARVTDNAAPDTEADEQFGHARTSAIARELSKRIVQIRKALARIKVGKYGICEECGQMIDTDRLMVYPEATLCAKDAAKRER